MPFSSLIGNERIKQLLKRAVFERRIGQALILAGSRGVGKHRFALALAEALNCEHPVEGDSCGTCLPCVKIAAGEHLDVETISRDGAFIKIDQMVDMCRKAQFRPFEGQRRVYIVDEAERLNEKAANSILKTLEEPPETSLIILVTAKPYALLDTIRSRCQMLSFGPLSTSELEAYLRTNYNRPIDETRMLAQLARGSIGRALEVDLAGYRKMRGIMLELVETMAVTRDSVRLMKAAEYMGKTLERDAFEQHLDVLLVILGDLFHLKLGEPVQSITNSDVAARLDRLAEATTLDEIVDWVEKIEAVLQGMGRNLNRQLAMDSVLIGG